MRVLKSTFLLIAFLLMAQNLISQEIFEKNYNQTLGTEIEQTSDGGYLIKGSNYVMKTDADGNEISTTQLADPMDGFNTTSDGGFIKFSTIEINDPFNTHTDIKLVKTDANDQEVWSTNIGDFQSETPHAVMEAADGGFLIAGSTNLINPNNGLVEYEQITCLIKTSADGMMEWKSYINSGNLSAFANRIIETDNSYVVAGPGYDANIPQASKIVVMQTFKSGSILNLYVVGNSSTRYILNDLAHTTQGEYILAGSKTHFTTPSNVSELYVEKRGGQFEWEFCKGEGNNFYNGSSTANAVIEDENGNIFIGGWYSGTGGNSFSSARDQSSLIKLNSEGQEQWGQLFPKNVNDGILTSDGHLSFIGSRNGSLKLVHVPTEKISEGCFSQFADYEFLTQHKKSYYYLSNLEWDWYTNDEIAYFFYDGELAKIETAEENEAIREKLKEQVFIGVNDTEEEGVLKWTDGEEVTGYTNLSTCDFCGFNTEENDFGTMNPWDGSWSFDNELVRRRSVMELECGGSEAITMNCPNNTVISLLGGFSFPSATLDWDLPTASTTCPSGNLIIEQIGGPLRGSTFDFETGGMITYLIMDECGNSTTCSFYFSVQRGCPPLEGYTKIGGVGTPINYFMSNEKYTPLEIANITLPPNAKFVEFNNPGDIGYVTSMLDIFDEMVYIGMNDAASEGDVVNADGSPVGFTNFDICDFCSPNSEEKDYVVMNHWNGGWSWAGKYEARKYIIQFDCLDYLYQVPENDNLSKTKQLDNSNLEDLTVKDSFDLASIYPNPSDDFVYLKIKNPTDQAVEIRIVNSIGRTVLNKKVQLSNGLNVKELNVEQLSKGLYFVQITNEQGAYSTMNFVKL